MSTIDFDDIDIVKKVESLNLQSVDSLPFGAVRLDNVGVVQTREEFLHRYRALHEYA